MKRAQSSLEFIILIIAVLFFFVILFISFQDKIGDKIERKRDIAVKEIALSVQDEIELAAYASNGYSRSFSLPLEASDKYYGVSIINNAVYVNTTDGKHAISVPVRNISGNIRMGSNTIRKSDGQIFLNS